jgi:predicted RNA-binding protein YlqC (UPF0109 family)
MKDILYKIVALIIDNTESLNIEEKETEGVIEYIIHVDPIDIGKVIGKEGKVIRAIRNVMKIPAMKQNLHIHIQD